jgi:hypothetical protein
VLACWLAMLVACARTGGEDVPDELHDSAPLPSATIPAVPLRLPSAMRDREWISIERTACYGACPQFTLTATAAGSVEWLGVKDVHLLGAAYRVVDTAALAEVYEGFATLDWLEIPAWSSNHLDRECSTDAPTTIVTLGRGRIARTLHDYHGCRGEELARMRSLETRLVELLAAPSWIEPGSDSAPSGADPCRAMAFRPLFVPRPGEPWTSFTDAALTTASHSLHRPGGGAKVRVVAVDNGDDELARAVDALKIDLSRHLFALGDMEARVVEPAPNRPAPGEIRMLVTPAGCSAGEVEDGDDHW